MKRFILLVTAFCALCLHAQKRYGVQLFDMYKTEAVYLMDAEEVKQLKDDLAEEKRHFNKALSNVKKTWTQQHKEAVKAGDKDFPKFPTKTFVWVRTMKVKNNSTDEAANEWYTKQKKRVDEKMTEQAAAIKAAQKAAKGEFTRGYASRDDKKARKKADKLAMDVAVREKLGEMVSLELSTMLKHNRPIPIHFIIDPVAGAEESMTKKIDKQDALMKAYEERKAAAEAADIEED
ncbi:MAG: hypothetical protein Q4C03_04835 [bacterium]|nr:hypothetical protein [bacterium]